MVGSFFLTTFLDVEMFDFQIWNSYDRNGQKNQLYVCKTWIRIFSMYRLGNQITSELHVVQLIVIIFHCRCCFRFSTLRSYITQSDMFFDFFIFLYTSWSFARAQTKTQIIKLKLLLSFKNIYSVNGQMLPILITQFYGNLRTIGAPHPSYLNPVS